MRKKAIEPEHGCKFIKIDPGAIYEIFRHIRQSTKKLLNKILTRLLRLEFQSDKIIKSKAIKFIVKKILPDYK